MSMKAASRTSSIEESYTNTNFWGIDGYKNTVKRLEDGATLCDEFMKMVHERAEIEMKYTLKLRDWSKRWNERINGKISEYGSMLEVFKSTLREAEDVAEIHVERHNRLKADLCESIKQWKNQHYHKAVLKWKEVKECETGFAKIYEPWARRYTKMDKTKKNFHRAAKQSEHASMTASNAEKDGNMPDKVKKLQDQDMKLKLELEEARKKYERRLSEMNASNDTYADELEAEFIKWERFEKVRLTFFKDALQRYHNVLDISENERMTNIYHGLLNKVRGSDATKDLKWWSIQYGPGMSKKWPEFEILVRDAVSHCIAGKLRIDRDATTVYLKNTEEEVDVRRTSTFRSKAVWKYKLRHDFEEPDVWNLPSNRQPTKQSFVRRLSLRKRNNKRHRRPQTTMTSPVQPDNTRLSESISYDSFSGSTEWSNEDISPNNNLDYDNPRSSYYQTPASALRESSSHDERYRSPSIVDDYTDAWNRSTTFSPTNEYQNGYSTYDQPSGINYYSNPGTSGDYDPNGTSNTKSLSAAEGMVDQDNESVDGISQGEPTGPSLNPFDNDNDDYVVEDDKIDTGTPKINGDIIENDISENREDIPGVPVRAKYDYEASEDDELSFHVGDIITQLSGEDGQGWCKGRLNDAEGLFPAKWVEAV